MKTGIIGASGYSGETLVRLLARHPQAELSVVTSRKLAGTPLAQVIPYLRGIVDHICFTNSKVEELVTSDVDVFFLALPHGVSAEFAIPLVEAGKTVIDLSADFRLYNKELYEEFYGKEHPCPEWLGKAPYLIPELMLDDSWKESKLIACAGCYPTSILTPLIPLVRSGVVDTQNIVISSCSGVSGGGKKADEFYGYSERTQSMVAYGAPKHRHLSEVEEQLTFANGDKVTVQFLPHLAPMRAGIESTIVAKAKGSLEDVYAAWNKQYDGKPFVSVLPSKTFPDTKYVVGSNRVDISAVYDERTGNFVINSAVDNLIKGASGQAIQIMNLIHGFDEKAGLI
jgi:N-acetyl-gamma-glutamyl-phosphate reductase